MRPRLGRSFVNNPSMIDWCVLDLLSRVKIATALQPACHHAVCMQICSIWILYTWVRASWIEFTNCPTRCDLFGLLYFCRQLYMFRVLTPIIRSSYNCNYSFWYWLNGSTTIRSRWVGIDSCLSYGRYSFVITNEYKWICYNKWIPTVR